MSKVFEALRKSRGEVAELTLELLGGDPPKVSTRGPKEPGSTVDDRRLGGELQLSDKVSGQRSAESADSAGLAVGRESDLLTTDAEQVKSGNGPNRVLGDADLMLAVSETRLSNASEPDRRSDISAALEAEENSSGQTAARHGGHSYFDPDGNDSSGVGHFRRAATVRLEEGTPLLPFDRTDNAVEAEQYRLIRTKLRQRGGQPQFLLISSAQPADGKTVTSINLAAALALNEGAQVLLVDTDLRRSSIAAMLGVSDGPGVTEVLAGLSSLDDAVTRLQPFPNFFFLPAGQRMGNPTELLSSPRWQELCSEIRDRVTYAVFDGPPVESVSDYRLLQDAVDGVLLVVRTNHTNRSLLIGALDAIPREKLMGAVVNSHRDSFLGKQRIDYRYYGYYSSKEGDHVSQS